jgi:CheY-like chemotaxis protein
MPNHRSESFDPYPPPAAGDLPPQILIADDDQQLRTSLAQVLQRHGYATVTVKNGRDALDYLAEHPVALMITDIFMPDFDGLELIFAMRKIEPRPRLIAMSGGDDGVMPDALNVAAALGAERLLGKPFDAEQLLRCVRETLG